MVPTRVRTTDLNPEWGRATGGVDSSPSGLRLTSITKSYGSTSALSEVTCTFGPGVNVVLGRNGAGKSTLCRVLAGVERPDSGTLGLGVVAPVGAADVSVVEPGRLKTICGYMPQHLAFPRGLRVADYLAYAAWLKGADRDSIGPAVTNALDAVGLADRGRTRLRALSGGMLRRVGLATAIVSRPAVVVLDEPTVGLDPTQRGHFYELMTGLPGHVCVVLSTHLMEDAHELAAQVVVLNDGTVAFDGRLEDFAAHGSGDHSVARLTDAFRRFSS